MKVLITEDEILLSKRLQQLLHKAAPDAVIAGVTRSVEETVNWLQTHLKPDLILMDIELADGQSFDIFQQTPVTSPVIFTTAYDEYAIKAFKVNSIDYLLKPIKEEELKGAIAKYKNLAQPTTASADIAALLQTFQHIIPVTYRERFLVKQAQRLISIDVNEVAYIFSENGFSYLRTWQNQKFIMDYTIDELEKTLSPKQFFRANRQYIVSAASIVAIHSWFNQKLKVDVKPAATEAVVISRDKAHAFKEWMGQ